MYECEELTRRINNDGQHALGPFPKLVARAMQNDAEDIIKKANQALKIECVSTVKRSDAGLICCSFCSKPSSDVAKMIGGKDGAICDECLVASSRMLRQVCLPQNFSLRISC